MLDRPLTVCEEYGGVRLWAQLIKGGTADMGAKLTRRFTVWNVRYPNEGC